VPPRWSPSLVLLGSALSFALMAFAAKLAARTLAGDELAFLRFAVMLAPFLLRPALLRAALASERRDLLAYRGVFGGVAVLLYFLAIEQIPVGTATLLNYSSPVWSVTLAALVLGERVRPVLLLPFGLALAGTLLVTGAFDAASWPPRVGLWESVALLSAILSGAAVTAIRAARRSESSWAIYASFTVCGLLVTAPFALAGFRWPSAREWALVAAVGAASIAAQLLMTYAYRWVTNLQAGVFAQVTVVVTMGLGVLLLGDRLSPLQLGGAALAIGGVLGVVVLHRPEAEET
jgi:drug/metabolite transporter (DMT)-like permease